MDREMSTSPEKRAELNKNFSAMSEKMTEFLALHRNKYALMRDGEVVEFYVSWQDAYRTGRKFYDDGLFSVQKVSNQQEDLGFFSYAVDCR